MHTFNSTVSQCISKRISKNRITLTAALLFCMSPLHAQPAPAANPAAPTRDVLTLDVTETVSIQPDTAVVVLAVERQGADAAPLAQEVNQVLARALREAKAQADVQATTGSYNTSPRYDGKGQRSGWVVRAELILKGREFATIGTLAGKLARELQIASNGFEISPELRAREEAKLTERAITQFRAKALAATKAFGYAGFDIREVAVGQLGGGMPVRPKMMMEMRGAVMAADASAMPVEPGARDIALTVSGSVQMKRYSE